jgi:23S rRNA (uridine2552-2'-O)-methyltransferase
LPKSWVRKQKRDYFYKKAKEEKYRSRSSFKILQVIKKYRFMRLNDVVVDLGAAPGGWIQISRQIVGNKGFILGIDIKKIETFNIPNIITIEGDIRNIEVIRRIQAILPRPADNVISDVSPNVSGIWEVDHARQIELAECSLRIASEVLKDHGNFFVKIFQGYMFSQILTNIRNLFSNVRIIKPKASRKESAEIYILGINYKGYK